MVFRGRRRCTVRRRRAGAAEIFADDNDDSNTTKKVVRRRKTRPFGTKEEDEAEGEEGEEGESRNHEKEDEDVEEMELVIIIIVNFLPEMAVKTGFKFREEEEARGRRFLCFRHPLLRLLRRVRLRKSLRTEEWFRFTALLT